MCHTQNIKQLLKMPYSSASVSLLVHRIGNTLMLDEFDVHRHLLRQQENEWSAWLHAFFAEIIRYGIEDSRVLDFGSLTTACIRY